MPTRDNNQFWELWKLGLLYNSKKTIKHLASFDVVEQLLNSFQCITLAQMGLIYMQIKKLIKHNYKSGAQF
jgi:hypothetical protein